MKRIISVFLTILFLFAASSGPIGTAAATGASEATVSLRIEGPAGNLYHNDSYSVATSTGSVTLADILKSLHSTLGAPAVVLGVTSKGTSIVSIGGINAESGTGTYGWVPTVNDTRTPDIDHTAIKANDEIVIYYGAASSSAMQIPLIDLSKMFPGGIVRFYSLETLTDAAGKPVSTEEAISGATVTWDGMQYLTDANGEIIIDSTGAGVKHTVQIERCDLSGHPNVVRFAPNYFVIYAYSDVPVDAWYADSVSYVKENAIFNGISPTEFAPMTPISRAMFVTALGRLSKADVDQSADSGYNDVGHDGWSTGYIVWATANGIVTGFGDGTFSPDSSLTREQLAAILYRYAQKAGYNMSAAASLKDFTDAGAISGYAKDAMAWAVGAGLLSGIGDNLLDPTGTATRAQAAAILQRLSALAPAPYAPAQ